MTKKFLLKLNMAIVFVVVLFAGLTFADERSDVAKQVISKLESYMLDGRAAILLKETLPSDTESRVILSLDSDSFGELSKQGISIYYGRDKNGEPYIAASYEDDSGIIRTGENND